MSPPWLTLLWLSASVVGSTPSDPMTFEGAATATPALTLGRAVELALRTEPRVAGARLVRDRASLATLRAQLDRFSFRVDAQLQELWFKTNIGSSRESNEGGLGLSNVAARLDVPFFSGLRVESNVQRREHLESAARFDLLEERRAAAIAVARAYWSVRRLSLLEGVERRALERLVDAEKTAASRVRSGIAPPIDENRAKARRLFQQVTLTDLIGRSRAARGRLVILLGSEVDFILVDAPAGARSAPAKVAILVKRARTGRPALRSADAQIEAQRESVDIALSGYYPQLNGFVLYQHGNNPALAGANASAVFASANPFNNLAGDLQVGVALSVNLFDTLNTYTAVKDARLEAARLVQESARIGRIVESEVRVARANVVRFLALFDELEAARALAEDNVAINRTRYENGEAQIFELLDSEIELLDVQRRLTNTTADLTVAWLELEAALGQVVGEET